MNQKRNKIIVLGGIIIVICVLGAILWYGFGQYRIQRAIKDCQSYLGRIQQTGDNSYGKPPAIRCFYQGKKDKTILLKFGSEGDWVFNEATNNDLIIFTINFPEIINSKKWLELNQIDIDQINFFQICTIIVPWSEQNKYLIFPQTFSQTSSHNTYGTFICSKTFTKETVPVFNLGVQKMLNNDYKNFKQLFYLISKAKNDKDITAENFMTNPNKYPGIFQF